MTEDIKKEQIQNAKDIIKVLQNLDIEPFIWAGTLLGAIREGDIISNDSDIDIAYVSKYHNAKDIINETKELYNKLIELGLLYDYLDETHQPQGPNLPIISVFGQAHLGDYYPHLDLFTMWVSDNTFYDTWFGPVAKDIDTTVVQDAVELGGVKFPTLKNPEWVLEMLYGVEWKIPQESKGTDRHGFTHALKEFKLASGIIE